MQNPLLKKDVEPVVGSSEEWSIMPVSKLFRDWFSPASEQDFINAISELEMAQRKVDALKYDAPMPKFEGYAITSYKGPSEGDTLIVPNIIDGKRILVVANDVLTYRAHFSKIVLSEGIIALMNCACMSNDTVEEFVLPQSLLHIGRMCFNGCNMWAITIPESVINIGESAFCSNLFLSVVGFRAKVNTMPHAAFSTCYSLRMFCFSSSVETIDSYAFAASALKHIALTGNIQTIRSHAFDHCNALAEVYIGPQVLSIADDAFDSPEKNPKLTMHVLKNSYAHQFANKHGYQIVIVDELTQKPTDHNTLLLYKSIIHDLPFQDWMIDEGL